MNGENGENLTVEESIIANPGENPYPQEKTLITNIKARKNKGLQTYEVYWLVPDTDEEAQEQYGCSLKDLITQGVRNLSTRPNYQLEFVEDKLTEDGHRLCQELANNYKVGQKSAGIGKEMKEIRAMAKDAGMTLAEIKELIQQSIA